MTSACFARKETFTQTLMRKHRGDKKNLFFEDEKKFRAKKYFRISTNFDRQKDFFKSWRYAKQTCSVQNNDLKKCQCLSSSHTHHTFSLSNTHSFPLSLNHFQDRHLCTLLRTIFFTLLTRLTGLLVGKLSANCQATGSTFIRNVS